MRISVDNLLVYAFNKLSESRVKLYYSETTVFVISQFCILGTQV